MSSFFSPEDYERLRLEGEADRQEAIDEIYEFYEVVGYETAAGLLGEARVQQVILEKWPVFDVNPTAENNNEDPYAA